MCFPKFSPLRQLYIIYQEMLNHHLKYLHGIPTGIPQENKYVESVYTTILHHTVHNDSIAFKSFNQGKSDRIDIE